MPRAKVGPTRSDLLSELSSRIETGVRLPNIYRYEPLPMQDLFHQRQTKGGILFGGNRGGKTFGGGADDVMVLLRRHPHRNHFYPPAGHPVRMRFIGVDFERGIDQGAVPLFKQLLPPSSLINGSWEDSYRPSEHMLTLKDGSTVSFMSYEQHPNKFQVVSLHHIHFDEEPPKAIWDESMLRLLDTDGTWTLSETPVMQLEWVEDELIEPAKDGRRPDISVFYLNTRENAHLSAQALAELESTLTEEEKVIRLEGRYKGGSLVFDEFKRTYPFVIPEESFKLTEEWDVYESMDHGIVNPTCWLWTAVHRDGSIVTFRGLYAKNIVVSEWAQLVLEMRRSICRDYGLHPSTFERMRKATVGDPSIADHGNSTAQTGITIQQAYANAGVGIGVEGIRQARSGNQNIGIDKMHTYLRPRPADHPLGPVPWWQIVDNPGLTPLVDELKKARKPRQSAQQKEVKNDSEQIRDKDNHAIDAAKYLFVISHDLRPQRWREKDLGEYVREAGIEMNAAPLPATTHAEVFQTTISADSSWSIYGDESYFAMEE